MKNLLNIPKPLESVNIKRVEREPDECRAIIQWREENANQYGEVDYRLLSQILKREPSATDCQTAETIIQWLGSPVGQGFLEKIINKNFVSFNKK